MCDGEIDCYLPVLFDVGCYGSAQHQIALEMFWAMLFFGTPPPLTILLALVPSSIIGWIIYARCFHPLVKTSGPFLASVARLWLKFDVATGTAGKTQARLHKQYGTPVKLWANRKIRRPLDPIVRIAPNEVAISTPEAIKTIHGAQDQNCSLPIKRKLRPPKISDSRLRAEKRPMNLTN